MTAPSDQRPSARMVAAAAILAGALSGCASAEYVAQAACGQMDISLRRRSVNAVVHDESTSPRIRGLLSHVHAIKAFAVRHSLTPTESYETYVDLQRPAVVWVVTASEPLRFRLHTWHFPVVGSVPYLGWFDRRDADAQAAELQQKGWDTDVRPSVAYSTLGWFSDPVLSSMIPESRDALGQLTDVVLHESLHATVYVKGQTPFNESLASFVARRLAEVYLDERLGPDSPEKKAYIAAEKRRDRRAKAMHEAYQRLEKVYTSSLPKADKLVAKQRLLDEIRAELGFARRINNATLAQSKAYSSGAPELETLLAACGGTWPRFFATLKKLTPTSFHEQHQRDFGKVIEPLAKAGCIAR